MIRTELKEILSTPSAESRKLYRNYPDWRKHVLRVAFERSRRYDEGGANLMRRAEDEKKPTLIAG